MAQPQIVVTAGAGAGAGPGAAAAAAATATATAGTDTERSATSGAASTPTVRLSARSAASASDSKEKALDAKDAAAAAAGGAKGSAKKRKKSKGKGSGKSKSKSKTRKPKDADAAGGAAGVGDGKGAAPGADGVSGAQPQADGQGAGAGGVGAGAGGVDDGSGAGAGAGGDPNSGLCACFLTRKAVEKWDLGVGISAAAMPGGVIYRKLSKAALLADINESGPESEFHSLSKQIKACPFDEILFVREDTASASASTAGADGSAGLGGAAGGGDRLGGGSAGGSAGGPAETGVYDYKFCTTEAAYQREWTRIQALEKAFDAKANATGSSAGGMGVSGAGMVGYGVDPKDNKTGSGGSSTALTAWDPQSPFLVKARQVATNFKVSEGVEDDVRRLHIKRKRGGDGQFGIPSAAALSGAPAVGSAAAVAAAAAAAASSGGPAPSGVPLPAIGYFITQPRFQFAAPYEFSDTAEVVSGFPHKSLARWNIERKELSMGFQAAATRVDASTQTHWARQVHKITQYEPNTMTDDEAARMMADPRMEHFLNAFVDPTPARAKRPGDVTDKLMTLALEQNETIDLFKDEFREFADDDSQIGQKADNTLKDAGAYTHSKANQNIAAIDWHPSQSKTSVVAFCCSHNLTFDRWVDSHSGKVLSSQIMFVNFSSDIIKPHITCEAPGNVLCFQLNPTNPNIVAAGLMTGQVMFWDISDRAEKAYAATIHATASASASSSSNANAANGGGASSREQKGAAGSAGGGGGGGGATQRTFDEYGGTGGSESTNAVKPRAMSYIDKSHSRPVTDVRWLPAGVEITRRGEVVRNAKSKVSHQFVTASGDGTISFWDVRLRDIYKTGTAEDQEATAEPKWMPAYTITLTKPDRSGVLAATKLALGLDTKMFVVTEDGEVATVDWSLTKMDEKDKVTALAVTSVRKAHLQPCTAVERCPHFPDIYLTVGDWSFIIWQNGVDDPLFVSPPINAENQLVAARWSPTRAGVIITALSSGYVEIWDLMDQTHHHSFSFKCSENSIASLEFWRSRVVIDPKHGPVANPYLQYLAVGDVTGRLRLLQMPKNLRKKQDMREERNLIRQFFDREIARAAYAKKRGAVRAAERKAAEEAQHLIDLQNQERLQALQAQQQLLGGPAASLGLSADGKSAADRSASALGMTGAGAGAGAGLSAKEQKQLAARRKQEALDRLKEERAAEERKRVDAEDTEEREYQALLDHYKKQFSDESFAQKLTVNLAAAAPLNQVKPDAPAAAAQPLPSARVKF